MFKYYMHQVCNANDQKILTSKCKILFLKVNPSEIEAVLLEHPSVQMTCVIGIPNEETTTLAKALVVLKEGKEATSEELIQLVANKLLFYKHLHGGVQFVDSLPENKGRKIDRVAISKLYG